jgi:hypothetical protein
MPITCVALSMAVTFMGLRGLVDDPHVAKLLMGLCGLVDDPHIAKLLMGLCGIVNDPHIAKICLGLVNDPRVKMVCFIGILKTPQETLFVGVCTVVVESVIKIYNPRCGIG